MRIPLAWRVPPAALVRVFEATLAAIDRLRRALSPAPAVMMQTILEDFVIGRSVFAVVELGVVDRLAVGSATVAELARDVGANADALGRVLKLLASRGLVAHHGDGRFGPTRFTACLERGRDGSLREWARYPDTDRVWPTWSAFLETLRNGRSLHENSHGAPFFAWLTANPDIGASFDQGMTAVSSAIAPAVVAAYDFSRAGSVVDVGGGQGALLAEILAEHPNVEGTLFDRSEVIGRARASGPCADPRLAPRCAFVDGDLFDALPAGRDLYVMKWILHDWQDDDCRRILRACRRAMKPSARLLVVEMVLEPRGASSAKLAMDVVMLTLSGGRERTLASFRALLASAGFILRRVVSTASPLSVLEAEVDGDAREPALDDARRAVGG